MRRLLSLTLAGLWLFSPVALAQLPGLVSQPLPGGGQSWSLPVQTLVFITSLTFLPAILLMMTSFTRIIIVFGLLRNALGTPSAPPNQVLLGLALFLTFFIMSPVIDKIYVDAYQPFSEEKISMQEAMEKGAQPLPGGGQSWSLPVQTLVFITSLTFLPAILLMMTSFTRIIIVFGLLRNALGTPSAPPNQVLLGLALFLTFFIMSPVIDKIYVDAYQPFSEEKISMQEAMEKGAQPLREFMLRQTREADLALFARLANSGPLQGPEAVPMRILLPAYVTSELKTAFQIGFTIFIPFLIIDLVIASVLMALGMMMVPPATIALPFKLMLFVLVDGWQLLVGSLAQSFYS